MKKLLACIALGCIATANSYAGTPLWMRDVQISPDGKEIVFCYKGDIYKVPAKGGTATQLTTQSSYADRQNGSPLIRQRNCLPLLPRTGNTYFSPLLFKTLPTVPCFPHRP